MNDYEIKKLYEEMEMYLIQSMKRNLGRHLTEENEVGFKFTQWQAEKLKELKRYQRENKKIIGRYTLGLDEDVSEHLQNELKQGSINAIKQYNKALGKDLKPSKVMNKSFFKTNDRKVNALIKVVNDDLKTANTSALRMANDQYRQIIHKSAFFVGNGVFTEKQAAAQAIEEISQKKLTTLAVDEASKNFLAGGLNSIEYSDGRRVNIASYAQMAVRTASLRTHLMGEGNFRASIGRTLVKVTTHGGACKLCTKWQGKVLVDDVYSGGKSDGKHTLLSDAMAQGFLHPSCRHGLTTYYPELEEDYEEVKESKQPITDEQRQHSNYINRNVKRFDRLSNGSLDKDNIKKYGLMKNAWQNRKPKEYIDINDEKVVKYKVNEYEQVIVNADVEHAYVINPLGEVFEFIGNAYKVDIPEWLNIKNAIITHNHPINETHYSLSADDINLFFNREIKELRGLDVEYIYFMIRTKNTSKDIESINRDILAYRYEALELSKEGKLDIDKDEYDYINKKLSEKYHFVYKRRKRK